MSQNLRSGVWQYFRRDTGSGTATCQLCKSTLKAVGGSTKGVHTHLLSKHKITLRKRAAAEPVDAENQTDDCQHIADGSSKRRTLNKFVISKKRQFHGSNFCQNDRL
jgi:hypothetical protein